ncbi:MAG: hypothetical protein ABI047_01585 [Jatrophihabitantaceae bacterium]
MNPGEIFSDGDDIDWGHDGRDPDSSGRTTYLSGGKVVTDTTYNGSLRRREVDWLDDDGWHSKAFDGQGNRESESSVTPMPDGSTASVDRTWNSTGEVLHEDVTHTSADGNTTVTTSRDRNADGSYRTTVSRTENHADGSSTTITKAEDETGKVTETVTVIGPTTSRPGPDGEGSAAEERPFAHTVIVGKSLGWQLPAREVGASPEGVPLGALIREALHDLIGDIVSGGSSGWGDAASEAPGHPPFEDFEVAGDDDDDSDGWGFVHPQALIGRALATASAVSANRLARRRLFVLRDAIGRE